MEPNTKTMVQEEEKLTEFGSLAKALFHEDHEIELNGLSRCLMAIDGAEVKSYDELEQMIVENTWIRELCKTLVKV